MITTKRAAATTMSLVYCAIYGALAAIFICWTGQQDPDFVADYLRSNDIPFDAVNEHPPFRASQSRKVYANAYLDDRAGLAQVFGELSALVRQANQMSEAR